MVAVQKGVHAAVLEASGFKDRRQKWANFHVLRESKMPAVLTENGFINYHGRCEEAEGFRAGEEAGPAHAEGVEKALGLKKKSKPAPKLTPAPKPDKLIRVKVAGKQVGAFVESGNAGECSKTAHKSRHDN